MFASLIDTVSVSVTVLVWKAMHACVRLFVKPRLLLVYLGDEPGSTLLGGEVVDFVGVLCWAIVKSQITLSIITFSVAVGL